MQKNILNDDVLRCTFEYTVKCTKQNSTSNSQIFHGLCKRHEEIMKQIWPRWEYNAWRRGHHSIPSVMKRKAIPN